MNIQLFIGNLNFETSREKLMSSLQEYGPVINLEIIKDKFTLKSKGFAHALVEDQETADRMIHALNGEIIDGRVIRVELFSDN